MNTPTPHPPTAQLHRASQLLHTATVLADEAVDADLPLCRALFQAVSLLTETSQGLVDDALLQMASPH